MSFFQKLSGLLSKSAETPKMATASARSVPVSLLAPLSGRLLSLEQSPDPVFAQKMIGDGIVIDPVDSLLKAPCAGVITQLQESKHALTIKTQTGAEVLIHIGIDTVILQGEGFEALVSEGDQVEVGQSLIRFDFDLVAAKAPSLQTAILITTGEQILAASTGVDVVAGENIVLTIHGDHTDLLTPVVQVDSNKSLAEQISCTEDIVVLNPQGLHARPSALLVNITHAYQSDIELLNIDSGKSARANSLTAIMGLNTQLGTKLRITTSGADAQQALKAVVEGFKSGLGEDVDSTGSLNASEHCIEDEAPLLGMASGENGFLKGFKAAPGIAIGQLLHQSAELPSFDELSNNAVEENKRLQHAFDDAREQLQQLIQSMNGCGMDNHSGVFEAHLKILEDPAILEQAVAYIEQGKSAPWAWKTSYQTEADRLSCMDNVLLAARSSDISDVGLRVLRSLMGIEPAGNQLFEKTILVQSDITPSEVITIDRQRVIGICTTQGGATSHAAILAGSIGIPYLCNMSSQINDCASGTLAILDAGRGILKLSPSESEIKDFEQQCSADAEAEKAAHLTAHEPAITQDGIKVEIAANIGSAEDARKAVELGSEAIGLLRSEFLYMERSSEPSLAEQKDVYQTILETLGKDRPVIIRTLDVGGDKPLAYLPQAKEENPFLGERGVRIGIRRPSILRKQIQAILQAAHAGRARIMFPMISSMDELLAVKKLVREEQEKLGGADVEIGIMIEVPSAALLADQFAREVDFFSIGTNDLTQYALAIDRGHPSLSYRVDGLHPAVLRLIDMTVKAGKKAGIWTGVCGGLASDSDAIPLLIGLGIEELSVSIPLLPKVKAMVRGLSFSHCEFLAQQALAMSLPEEVRSLTTS